MLAICCYFAAIIATALLGTQQFDDAQRKRQYLWGNFTALHLALALLPVARNSIWTVLLGIGFERAVRFHRYVSRITIICLLGHIITMTQEFDTSILTSSQTTGSGRGNVYGIVAAAFMFAMTLLSLEPIRRRTWELFYYTHYCFLFVLVFACLHSTTCFYLCIGPIVLYAFDRVFRIYKGQAESARVIQDQSFLVLTDKHRKKGICQLTMKKPGFTAKEGQYVFLNCPKVSPTQWHPFSLSSLPCIANDYQFTVHIQCPLDPDMTEPSSWTSGLYNLVSDGILSTIKVDGPYGSINLPLFEHYTSMIIVAGGIGITPFSTTIQMVCDRWAKLGMQRNKSFPLQTIHVIWAAAHPKTFDCLPLVIRWAMTNASQAGKLKTHYFCTGAGSIDEPNLEPRYRAKKASSTEDGIEMTQVQVQVNPMHTSPSPLSPSALVPSSESESVSSGVVACLDPLAGFGIDLPSVNPLGMDARLIPGSQFARHRPKMDQVFQEIVNSEDVRQHGSTHTLEQDKQNTNTKRRFDKVCVLTCGPLSLMEEAQIQAELYGMDFHKETFFF